MGDRSPQRRKGGGKRQSLKEREFKNVCVYFLNMESELRGDKRIARSHVLKEEMNFKRKGKTRRLIDPWLPGT